MKILVIGCGSIGQRHIRNLVFLKAGDILVFDINRERLKKVKNISSVINVSNNLNKLWKELPEIVFITVPTALHIRYALKAARRGSHLFIEKPLSDSLQGVRQLIKVVNKKNLISMIGCNMRFYWAIAKIKNLLEENIIGKVISTRIETGQYLPDWHPGEDYRRMYSAKKELGGGIILDAIHEIDYAKWFFGKVEGVVGMYGRLSNLKIETEDVAEILLKFKSTPIVNIHMDYIQRSYSRGCKIIGEKGTISWNFNDHRIKLFLSRTKRWGAFYEPKNYNLNQMYLEEIKYFLNCVQNKRHSFNDIEDAIKTLKIALAVKKNRPYD